MESITNESIQSTESPESTERTEFFSQSCRLQSSTSILPSSFSTKQSLHRSVSRLNNLLPKSPHKKVEVIEKLAEKYQVKFQFKKGSCGRPRKDLNKRKRLADRVSLSC